MDLLGDISEGDQKTLALPCGHRFHKGCIRQWTLRGNFTCALCRQPTCLPTEELQPIPMILGHVLTYPVGNDEAEVTQEECQNIEWLATQLNVLCLGMKDRELMESNAQFQVSTDRFFLKTRT
jgi:hypothetical protein